MGAESKCTDAQVSLQRATGGHLLVAAGASSCQECDLNFLNIKQTSGRRLMILTVGLAASPCGQGCCPFARPVGLARERQMGRLSMGTNWWLAGRGEFEKIGSIARVGPPKWRLAARRARGSRVSGVSSPGLQCHSAVGGGRAGQRAGESAVRPIGSRAIECTVCTSTVDRRQCTQTVAGYNLLPFAIAPTSVCMCSRLFLI